MASRPDRLVVLGAGPVGLLAALRGRQLGLAVELKTDRVPNADGPNRLEALPAPMLGLLVEFGIHPRSFGVTSMATCRATQWGALGVTISHGPPTAYVARPALDAALFNRAVLAGVQVTATVNDRRLEHAGGGWAPLVDASGRTAATAWDVVRPPTPLVCRTFMCAASPWDADGFGIADGRQGYAYRLQSSRLTTVGVVGHGRLLRGRPDQVLSAVQEFAPWLVEGIDPSQVEASGACAASAQWRMRSRGNSVAIGDARIAHDALASQGMALGFADALRTVDRLADGIQVDAADTQLVGHCSRVAESIGRSRFAGSPKWAAYQSFLLRAASQPTGTPLVAAEAG